MEAISGATQATLAAAGSLLDDRYELLERIGRGGMADVYSAEDTLLHRRVAVKLFRFDLCTADELRRVHAEMQTLASLQHPGLVTIYDAGTVHDGADALSSPYLVMQLVGGPNLGRRLAADGPLGVADTAWLGAELAATLAYVHARNVVHRDVKPANILLDATIADDAPFATKLTDFGIARVVDSTQHTETGFTIGTANYLSPEQALSRDVGTATDVYSLGLVLVECLTGELAYPGTGVEAALARLNRPPAVPTAFGSAWHRLLTAATEREAVNRPSAAELAAELAELAGCAVTAPVLLAGAGVAGVPAPAPGPAAGRAVGEDTQAWIPDFAESPVFSALFPAAEAHAAAPADRRLARHGRPGRTGWVAAAMLAAAALLSTGFLMRSAHSDGSPATVPTRAAVQSPIRSTASSPATRAAAVTDRSSSSQPTMSARLAATSVAPTVAASAPQPRKPGPGAGNAGPGKPGGAKPGPGKAGGHGGPGAKGPH